MAETRRAPRRLQRGRRLKCWAQVDEVLAALGHLEDEIAEMEKEHRAQLADVEEKLRSEKAALEQRRERLAEEAERFCRERWPELDRVNGHGRRSRRLLFGRVGWRASQAVTIRSEAAAMKALAGWRAARAFLRVRTELDREALREFLVGQESRNGTGAGVRRRLRRAGIALEHREKWYYEIDRKAVQRWGVHYRERNTRGRRRR